MIVNLHLKRIDENFYVKKSKIFSNLHIGRASIKILREEDVIKFAQVMEILTLFI